MAINIFNFDIESIRDAVKLVIEDLKNRSGLDGAWDSIDYGTRKEIEDEWVEIIKKEIL